MMIPMRFVARLDAICTNQEGNRLLVLWLRKAKMQPPIAMPRSASAKMTGESQPSINAMW